MPDTPFAALAHPRIAVRATRSLLVALLALSGPVACVTTRVVEQPRAGDGAIDVPEAPPFRTGDASWGNGSSHDAPDVRVWLLSDQTYQHGDPIRALFRVREDAYVTIVRLDTDGRMRILYPRTPIDDGYITAGHSYRVPGYQNASFLADDPTGVGYVFAITSYKPFDYSRYAVGGRWDYVALGGRVHGDPLVAMRDFAERIAADAYTGYATDYAEYYVDRRVDYPRYAYPDCGAVRVGVVYDPYDSPCGQWVVVIYDDSYYYPYRYYPGTRVVYAPQPRYEWKPTSASTPGNAAHRVAIEHRRRPTDVDPAHWPGRVANGNNPGSTHPGGAVPPGTGGGRRRPDDAGPPSGPPPHYGAGGPPRRDSSRVTPPVVVPGSNGNGGANNGGSGNGSSNNGDDRANHGRGPRQDPATTRDGGHDNGRGRGDGDTRDDKRRTGDDSTASTRPVPPAFRHIIRPRAGQPRTDSTPSETPRADVPPQSRRPADAGQPQGDPAHPEPPRAEPPRTEPPRAEPPRADSPRTDSPRTDSSPRSDDDRPRRDDDRPVAPPSPASGSSSSDHPAPPPAERGRPSAPERRDDARSKSDSSKDDDRPSKPTDSRRRLP